MSKLIFLLVLGSIVWRMFTGRWPWKSRLPSRNSARFAEAQARALLGVEPSAGRIEIVDAHRRRIALVHPDRGGSNEQVHEANAARDLLLAALPGQ